MYLGLFLRPGSKNQNCIICFPLFTNTGQDPTSTVNSALVFGDMDDVTYIREGEQADVDGTMVLGVIGSHVDFGWLETNPGLTGLYQFGIPDAATALGSKWVDIYIGADNADLTEPVHIHIDLQLLA